MIYQRYRLGTHATKMRFLGLLDSLLSSGLTADGLEHLSGDILDTLLGTQLVTSVVRSSTMGAPGTQCLVVTLVTACSTSVQVGSSCPVIFLPTTTVLVVQSGSAW